jgi:hypothetical protein
MEKHLAVIAAVALCVSACAAPSKAHRSRAQMTQREKDSVVAESGLPGAGVVKKALSMSDAEARQQAELDSAAKEN